MGTFTIKITTGNAAFQPDWSQEVRHILAKLVHSFDTDLVESGRLFDINGNECGRYEYSEGGAA